MVEQKFLEQYKDRLGIANSEFRRIVDGAFNNNYQNLAVNGYDNHQKQMLVAALAVCVNPDILKLSHCAHRAVVACVGLYFEEFPDNLIVPLVQNHPGNLEVIKVGEGPDAARVFMAYGYNNWFRDADNNLDCKIMPGAPNEVPIESLLHLKGRQMIDQNDFDNACVKRTEKVDCHIEHAESSVISSTMETFQKLGVKPAQKTVLACTWVSCPDCMEKIKTQKDVYGEDLEVFPILAAAGDEEDRKMAIEGRRVLNPNGLNHLHGPYIEIPKNSGYGWFPAMKDTPALIRELLKRKTLEDRTINNLLQKAFELTETT